MAGLALLWALLTPLKAGQIEAETGLRRELGPITPRQAILGQFWNHTPEYYQARVANGLEKLGVDKIVREQFGLVDQLTVAYLQLEQYDAALATINRKEAVDSGDYGLLANRSLIYAKRALSGRSPDASADWTAALANAQAALGKAADPLKRDALYLRLLGWLKQAAGDPGMRLKQSVLGYDILARFDEVLARDRAAGIEHPLPLNNADVARLLGEDPLLIETLTALIAIDSLATPDGILALSDLCAVQGELETAYYGYCRLGELNGRYPGDFLEQRRQRLLQRAQALVTVGADERIPVALDAASRMALDEQSYQRYLAARRAAQAYTQAYDRYEREQLKLPNLPSQRKLLEAFHKQVSGAVGLQPADLAEAWRPIENDELDKFDSNVLLTQIAIWVPLALVCVILLLSVVRFLRRFDRMSVGS